MIEKLKSFGEAAKNIVIFVVTPLAFIAGFVWFLITKERSLKDELEAAKGDEELRELRGVQTEKDRAAADALYEYERERRDALYRDNSSLRQSTGGAEGTDSDSGPGGGPDERTPH